MRDDYRCDGVLIAHLPTEYIGAVLRDGFEINNADGISIEKAHECVEKRLRLELDIRRLGLR